MKELSAHELSHRLLAREDIQIIDVREPYEHQICSLDNAELIPLQQIPRSLERISRTKPVIMYCHYGIRSANVAQYLNAMHSYQNVYNLKGGIDAWSKEIDPKVPVY